MIFQLSKNKNDGIRPVEAETLQRWRELSKGEAGEQPPQPVGSSVAPGSDPSLGAARSSSAVGRELTWSDRFLGTDRGSSNSRTPDSPAWSFEESLESWRNSPLPDAGTDRGSSRDGDYEDKSDSLQERNNSVENSEIRSALGPGTVIEGKLRFDSPVRIDGNLIGEVTSTSTLVVGEQAVVKAIVHVGKLVVLGQVTGQVEAAEMVQVKEGGVLEANIKTKNLVIDSGGFFRGGCNT